MKFRQSWPHSWLKRALRNLHEVRVYLNIIDDQEIMDLLKSVILVVEERYNIEYRDYITWTKVKGKKYNTNYVREKRAELKRARGQLKQKD